MNDFFETCSASPFFVARNLLARADIEILEDLTAPLYVDQNLMKFGQLKDYNLGTRSALDQLELPQVDMPHMAIEGLGRLDLWKTISEFFSKNFGFEDLQWFGSHMLLKRRHSDSKIDWHQDLAYWGCDGPVNCISVLIPTSPTNPESGGLEYLKENVQYLLPHAKSHSFSASLGITIDLNHKKTEKIHTELGDVVFHNPFSVHRSLANRSNYDRSIFAAIFSIPESRND